MKYLIMMIILALLTITEAGASWNLVDLQELSIDYKNFEVVNPRARNLLIYPEAPKESVNLNIKTDFLEHFFWDSTIESYTTTAKYQSIGLETRVGFSLTGAIDIMYYHHSQHVLDRPHSYIDKFPVEDAIEVKLYLYRAKPGRNSIF